MDRVGLVYRPGSNNRLGSANRIGLDNRLGLVFFPRLHCGREAVIIGLCDPAEPEIGLDARVAMEDRHGGAARTADLERRR